QLSEAQARIAALEKTVRDLQRTIEIKNESLAQAQTQADGAKGKAPEPAKDGTVAIAPAAIAPAPAPITTAQAPKAAQEPAKAETATTEPAKAPETKAPPPPPKAVPAPVKEPPGFFSDLVANMPAWAIGAGILAILAGIAAFVAGRRRKATKFEDSIISGTDIKTNTVFGSTGGGVVNTGENSLASDFSREGLGNIDTDEVD